MQSRLDYFLISIQLSYNISNCTIKSGLKSDHSLINITLDLINTQRRGNSYWKFNNALLFDNAYIQLIKDEITSVALNTHIKKQKYFMGLSEMSDTFSYYYILNITSKEEEGKRKSPTSKTTNSRRRN